MEIENLKENSSSDHDSLPFDFVEESTFKLRMKQFATATANEISYNMKLEYPDQVDAVSSFECIIHEFCKQLTAIIDGSDITENNETTLNNQHEIEVEYDYLTKKLKRLQSIASDYRLEKEAWEENLNFFKNPLNIRSVDYTDCVFENINDIKTLSVVSDHCEPLLSILRQLKEADNDISETRRGLVDSYEKNVLTRWNAVDSSVSSVELSLSPTRKSVV